MAVAAFAAWETRGTEVVFARKRSRSLHAKTTCPSRAKQPATPTAAACGHCGPTARTTAGRRAGGPAHLRRRSHLLGFRDAQRRRAAMPQAHFEHPYRMLYDLTAIDERERRSAEGQPAGDFTVVYHLLSLDRNEDVRIRRSRSRATTRICPRSPICGPRPTGTSARCGTCSASASTATRTCARILMPPSWEGHPLRKEHPARATEMGPFRMPAESRTADGGGAAVPPRRLGHAAAAARTSTSCSSTSARTIPARTACCGSSLQLDGEEIVDAGARHRLPPPRRREDGRAADRGTPTSPTPTASTTSAA